MPRHSLTLRVLMLLAGFAGGACSGVSGEDSLLLMRFLDAMPTGRAADEQQRLLVLGCSGIPSCAGGCGSELAQAADPATPPLERGAIVARCRSDWRAARDRGASFDAWLRAYLASYANRAELALPPADQARLDAARARLRLQ